MHKDCQGCYFLNQTGTDLLRVFCLFLILDCATMDLVLELDGSLLLNSRVRRTDEMVGDLQSNVRQQNVADSGPQGLYRANLFNIMPIVRLPFFNLYWHAFSRCMDWPIGQIPTPIPLINQL